ncbi:MAG: hypothetical protein ACRD2L_05350, partial [Terriglobia bacterium]
MSLFGSGGGGGTPAPTQTFQTTKAEPWEEQKVFLTKVFQEAQKQYQAAGPEYFPGSTITPLDPLQTQAQNDLLNFANTTASQFANQNLAANQFLLGPALYPESNPALAAFGEALIRPLYTNLNTQILPNIRGEFGTGGQYGSSRQGIAEGLASQGTQTVAG